MRWTDAAGQADWLSNNLYDRSGWLLAQCVSRGGYTCATGVPSVNSDQPLDQRYRYDVYGNLKTQYHNGQWRAGGTPSNSGTGSESYVYDVLHRLKQTTRVGQNSSNTVTYSYDHIGGLSSKSDYADTYVYDLSRTHRLLQTKNGTNQVSSYGYDANGNINSRTDASGITTLQYDIANLPRKIVKGSTTADFYEASGGRYLQRLVAGGVTRDTYSLEKSYEREVVGGTISVERYYLTGGSLLTIKSDGRKLNYLHADRLGSPVSITERSLPSDGRLGATGSTSLSLVEHRGFDAFGKALDGQWGISNAGLLNLPSGQAMNTGKRNQRGFTGHEHLDEFALIHMNGRAYDYNVGRFYGVDPFIQFPSNSQSLNPYSYLMNNPLAGTDPTGYLMSDTQLACIGGPQWVCNQAQASDAYRSGYAHTPLWKQLMDSTRSVRSNGAFQLKYLGHTLKGGAEDIGTVQDAARILDYVTGLPLLASNSWLPSTGVSVLDNIIENKVSGETITTSGEMIEPQLLQDVSRPMTVERVVESVAELLSIVSGFTPARMALMRGRLVVANRVSTTQYLEKFSESNRVYDSYEAYLAVHSAEAKIRSRISQFGLDKHLGDIEVQYAGARVGKLGGVDPLNPKVIKIYQEGLDTTDREFIELMVEEIHHSKTMGLFPATRERAFNQTWNSVVEPRAKSYAKDYANRLLGKEN